MLHLLIKGLLIGYSLAAPVGPISLIFINRTLKQGLAIGLFSGLGVATADAIYGAIPAYGLTLISNFLIHYQFWLRLCGGLFFLYLAFKIGRAAAPNLELETKVKKVNFLHAFSTIFFLTLTNPMTILGFLGIFIGLGLGSQHTNHLAATSLIVGVFLGSMLWWLFFGVALEILRKKHLRPHHLEWLNKVSALILVGFSVWIFLEILY